VEITIRDTGTGIPKADLLDIFKPYFTTKEEGTGLGLAICYGIIKGHDGDIEVESEAGKGTTFRIFLPERSRQETRT
jgi:signal transduction histidine kinase